MPPPRLTPDMAKFILNTTPYYRQDIIRMRIYNRFGKGWITLSSIPLCSQFPLWSFNLVFPITNIYLHIISYYNAYTIYSTCKLTETSSDVVETMDIIG